MENFSWIAQLEVTAYSSTPKKMLDESFEFVQLLATFAPKNQESPRRLQGLTSSTYSTKHVCKRPLN